MCSFFVDFADDLVVVVIRRGGGGEVTSLWLWEKRGVVWKVFWIFGFLAFWILGSHVDRLRVDKEEFDVKIDNLSHAHFGVF